MSHPACHPITSLPLTRYRAKKKKKSELASFLPEDGARERESEMHMYYTWRLYGMNRPRQIGHISLRRRRVSEGSQLLRLSFRAEAKITKTPPSSPERRGRGALRKASTPEFPVGLALRTSHVALHSLPANDFPLLRDRGEGEGGEGRGLEVKAYMEGKILMSIMVEDGCVPGAGDFQTGTLNSGDMEISDTAGYSASAARLRRVQSSLALKPEHT